MQLCSYLWRCRVEEGKEKKVVHVLQGGEEPGSDNDHDEGDGGDEGDDDEVNQGE